MEEKDTILLLKECNAGVKMGVASIDSTLKHVQSHSFREKLEKCKHVHQALGNETGELLGQYQEDGKEPNPMAKSMSWLKTNLKTAMEDSDKTAADLITDGCNMGVKSLNRYLNQYPAADERVKNITRRLIDSEHQLTLDIRQYL